MNCSFYLIILKNHYWGTIPFFFLFLLCNSNIMTSWDGNIFRVTGPLCGEFTGHRWISHTKANDTELWCWFWICAWINDWVNNPEAGDLRRRRDHYDGTVMNQHRLDYSSWRMYASPGIELDNYSYDKNYESVSLLSTYQLSVSKRCRKYISVK